MNRLELMQRTRSLVRDISNSFFREDDIINYLNEGIERVGQRISELKDMPLLLNRLDEVQLLPRQWHHLLAVYCASRLCTHDERHYQAGTFMNEFETKLDELSGLVNSGEVEIVDADGNLVDANRKHEYVSNRYFMNRHGRIPKEEVIGE